MKNIWIIAKSTFLLEIKDKILYGVLVFGLLYVGFSLFFAQLVLHELQMVKGFALAGIYFFNAIVALFLGTTSFFKDVDRKIVYFLISKPLSRAQFLLGKFFGLCFVLLATSALFAVAYLGIIAHEGAGFDALGLLAIFMQFLEMALFIAFAIFVSTFASSLLSIVYTSGVFFLGHIVSQLIADAQQIRLTGFTYRLIQVLYYVFPNLEKFNIRDIAVHNVAFSGGSFFAALGYAVVYMTLLLFAATWVFDKKEI